ncbi:LysR family substrate-binding domain-containing protein [Kribbella sp. NPDC050124]|uniref:LysR family substrate-binding domain-containing protein n=1 Tax=Kribbella sp. NPDC050124 TaxID=3364114 RepID=UPI0037A03C1E
MGFVGTATYAVLPSLATALRDELPMIEPDLRGEMLTPDLIAGLRDRSLDLAFIRPPVGDPDLDITILRREPLLAVLPDTHVLAGDAEVNLAALRDEPFISYPSHQRSVMYAKVLDSCHRAGFRPQRIQQVAETSTLVASVAAGLGLALVPEAVQALRISGATYRPLVQQDVVELAVATRAGDDAPPLRRVLDMLPRLLAGTTDELPDSPTVLLGRGAGPPARPGSTGDCAAAFPR